jgi:hypothetical protein
MTFYIMHSIGMHGFIHLFIFHINSKTVVMMVAVGFYGRQSVVFIIALSVLISKPTIWLDPESDPFLSLTTCGCHQIPLLVLSYLNPICTYFSKINVTLKLVVIAYFHVLSITRCLVSLDTSILLLLLCIPSSLGVKPRQDKRQESIAEMLADLNNVT